MVGWLCYVPAKPLISQPRTPASSTLIEYLHAHGQPLRLYDRLPASQAGSIPGIGLSILDAIAGLRHEVTRSIQPLPPLPQDITELDAIASENRVDEDAHGDDNEELPQHLQPTYQEDGIPDHSESDEEDGQWDLEAELAYEETAYDDSDLKNLPDFDPDQDPERHLFREQVLEDWSRADREECSKGAMPRFYKQFDVLKKEPNEITFSSDDYTTTPLSTSSPLAPYLLVYQIPSQAPTTTSSPTPISTQPSPKTDDDFLDTYQRYAFLSSHDNYKRITAFKQDDRTWPRWLVIQEFTDWYHNIALKKKQGEYWWRKHGYEGVLVEGFRLREGGR